ncbi:MAG: RES family NAD+ phosphorylase [Proteobacteria bacterium]|nr:RES family NAD+ phosphorylase [Pseudomonadota bacterium]
MPEFKSVWSYNEFARRVTRERRYIRQADDDEFLNTVLETSKDRRHCIKKGHIFWRAQLGHDWRAEYQDDQNMGDVPCPHSKDRMKPFKHRAVEGRINPKGISCLYLATERDTALSEVRPWIGSLISVGQFKTLMDLVIIDCSRRHAESFLDHLYFERDPTPADKEAAVWKWIDSAFAAPVDLSNEAADYVPTQIIAELFRNNGCDGIAYKSAFGKNGYNVALFDIDAAKLINCFLYEAKTIQINYDESANPYFVKCEDKD